jgi:putative addiction module antidote
MVTGKIRKVGNSCVVTIPHEEMKRLGLHEGDLIGFEPRRVEIRTMMSPQVQAAYEQIWMEHQEGLRYLAEH